MHAKPGDWLVVETPTVDRHGVRGMIEEVLSANGEPPYRVRWTYDDHVSLVFPGPDARVLPPEELASLDQARAKQFTGRRRDLGPRPGAGRPGPSAVHERAAAPSDKG